MKKKKMIKAKNLKALLIKVMMTMKKIMMRPIFIMKKKMGKILVKMK